MSDFEKGDRVMATKDIGFTIRKGDEGVVVETGWFDYIVVKFEGKDKKQVGKDEIAKC